MYVALDGRSASSLPLSLPPHHCPSCMVLGPNLLRNSIEGIEFCSQSYYKISHPLLKVTQKLLISGFKCDAWRTHPSF